jgi:uncharacterized membrane protein (DUF485 family)
MPHGDIHACPYPDHPDAAAGTTADATTAGTHHDATDGRAGGPGFHVLHGTEPLADDTTLPWKDGTRPRPGHSGPPGHHGDLRRLRRTYRIQRRTTTFLALGYFSAFLVLSTQYPAFMARPLADGLPTGLVLALSHVPVTWLAVLLYERTARRFVDPLARRVTRYTPWAAETGREQGR